ncbi:hypothetical protein KVR01_011187 [Diaporthe batatas]|uniref:uncharacterized protein n=1 Tax=Diaporthe batatas TaxID=748121 RepID=UPI001D0545E3|nr:uncharacterized protein KVR01_011187 [Diaporthe batatas]KAG8158744.1 hypothetical protein KVR01_011187 [Diaporthe batatas]
MAPKKNKKNKPNKSPFEKLFSSDVRADKGLQEIRDNIYSFAWSRARRDEAKLDWALSENGVDRNVLVKRPTKALSGPTGDHIDALPCWLLVNKRISADFLRFIYSVNQVDILVDLKATDTELNRAKLDKIVHLLQNANFQLYTKSARVRIHFPDKYPFQDLPKFNQHALDNIACALDEFQNLESLCVRVVPMQGPEDYELRLAAFPFYPMSMTNWSICMLNSTTFEWEPVLGEQLNQLDLAWTLFQDNGSLTAPVHAPIVAEKPAIHNDQTPSAKGTDDAQKNNEGYQKKTKNGSQKKKGRKKGAASISTDPPASKTTSEVPSADLSLRPKSPFLDPPTGVGSSSLPVHNTSSGTKSSPIKSSITEMHCSSAGESASTASPAYDAVEPARPRAPSSSSTKPESTSAAEHKTRREMSDEVTDNKKTVEECPVPASVTETAPRESVTQLGPQNASPTSSAASSVTLGRDQSDHENEVHDTFETSSHGGTTLRGAGPESEKPARKKRKNRKKGQKTQVSDTAATSVSLADSNDESEQQNSADIDGGCHAVFFSAESTNLILAEKGALEEQGWDGMFRHGHRPFPLSEIAELKPLDGHTRLLQYKRTNGNKGILEAGPDLDRLMRQKERLAARETERQAEKMRAKGKRKNKKVKEVMIRRKEPSDGLRRRFEDTKQRAASNQGSDLRKRFKEITAEGFEDAVPEAQGIGLEQTDSSDFSSDDTPSSPEQAHRLPLRQPRFGTSHDSYRNCPMGEQRLIEEVEDSDDDASVVRQYSDEGPPSVSDDESQRTEA